MLVVSLLSLLILCLWLFASDLLLLCLFWQFAFLSSYSTCVCSFSWCLPCGVFFLLAWWGGGGGPERSCVGLCPSWHWFSGLFKSCCLVHFSTWLLVTWTYSANLLLEIYEAFRFWIAFHLGSFHGVCLLWAARLHLPEFFFLNISSSSTTSCLQMLYNCKPDSKLSALCTICGCAMSNDIGRSWPHKGSRKGKKRDKQEPWRLGRRSAECMERQPAKHTSSMRLADLSLHAFDRVLEPTWQENVKTACTMTSSEASKMTKFTFQPWGGEHMLTSMFWWAAH